MFKKILIVLMIGCFLLGMATKAEAENAKEEAKKEAKPVSTAVEGGKTLNESTGNVEIPQIQLTTVYEKTFDEEIVDVVLDTATVSVARATAMGWKNVSSFAQNDKVKVNYPKIGIKPKDRSGYTELVFFDKQAGVVNRVKVGKEEHIDISSSGEYVLVGKVAYEAMPLEGGVVYSSSGKKILDIPKNTPLIVSNEGYIIAREVDSYLGMDFPAKSNPFYIYDNKENIINEIKSPVEEGGAPCYAKFAGDGQFAALMFEGCGLPPSYLYLITRNGEVIWKAGFPEYRFAGGKGLDIVADVGVAVKLSNKVIFVDWGGDVRWEFPLEIGGDMIVKINGNTNKVYAISTEGYVWCIDMKSGKLVWKHKESWSPEPTDRSWKDNVPLFREARFVDNYLYIVGKWDRNWHSTTLFILDASTGKLLKQEEYPNEKVTFGEGTDKTILYNISKNSLIQVK
jgi:outer membrane protein assembly factor BamB